MPLVMKPSPSNLVAIIIGIVLIGASGSFHIDVPQSPVPITLQSMVCLSFCFVFRPPIGLIAVSLFLVLGIIGIPVFADGTSGLEIIAGKTGGYLIGFLIAGIFMGEFNRLQWPFKIGTALLAMTIGTFLILACGYIKLGLDIGWDTAFDKGIVPFLPGALIKIVIGAYLSIISYRFLIGRGPRS